MSWKIDEARAKGVPVGDVIESWAAHLSKQRKKARDNPRQLEASAPPDSYSLAVTQHNTARGVTWRTLGSLPHDIEAISVTASTWEAAKNKTGLHGLLEQRYRAEFASALQRAGLYKTDLEGRRAVMAVAIASSISVANLADVVAG